MTALTFSVLLRKAWMPCTDSFSQTANQLPSSQGGEQRGLSRRPQGRREQKQQLCPPAGPGPAPLAQSPRRHLGLRGPSKRPLTHRSAAAAPCTLRRASGESCSPGEPWPPRPPWGGVGVAPPSCGTEQRGRGGEGGSFGETPWRCGAAGGGGERRGLRSGAPRQSHAPALSRRRPAGHCALGAAGVLTTCSAVGSHKGRSQRAPL